MASVPANSVLHMARAIEGVQGQLRPGEELVVEVLSDRADLVVWKDEAVIASYGSVYFARPGSED